MASSTEANKALVKRYAEHGFAEVLKGNLDAVHEYLHDHYVRHTGTKHDRDAKDLHSVKQGFANMAGAFSGARHRVDAVVADGDMVAVHWHMEAKHTGHHRHHAGGHVEGSGSETRISGLSLYRVQDGKIAESWTYDNHFDAMIDAGALTVARSA